MNVAVWDIPALDPMIEALIVSDPGRFTIRRADPRACGRALKATEVEVALVSSLDVFREPESTRLLPGIGLVSQGPFPYAQLHVRGAITDMQLIAFDPVQAESVLLARLIARETYGLAPKFLPLEHPNDPASWPEVDGVVVTGREDRHRAIESRFPTALDLGLEWYELTTLPMVWGLFATKLERFDEGAYRLLLRAAEAADQQPDEYLQIGSEGSPVRSRLDEFALQGLEEFANYLFLTGALDEVPNLRFSRVSEDDGEPGPSRSSSCPWGVDGLS